MTDCHSLSITKESVKMDKRVKDSYAEQVHVLTLGTLNGYNRLFGGQLMAWIDEVAAVVARRHSSSNVTTASIDHLEFKKAAHANDTLVLKGKITYAGTTSMEINVKTYVEKLTGESVLINDAYVIMVALDKDENPKKIPGLILETDEEINNWSEALKRRENRKKANI